VVPPRGDESSWDASHSDAYAAYATFGLLASPGDAVHGLSDPRFLSPGAPFGVWAGLSFHEP
jgi:hypothetical protein